MQHGVHDGVAAAQLSTTAAQRRGKRLGQRWHTHREAKEAGRRGALYWLPDDDNPMNFQLIKA
jgi:hypothetical protein